MKFRVPMWKTNIAIQFRTADAIELYVWKVYDFHEK